MKTPPSPAIAVDREGGVWVADRENNRIQRFDADGRYREEWTDLARPCQVFIDGKGQIRGGTNASYGSRIIQLRDGWVVDE